MKSKSGFTLVEVLIVIVIIGILLAISTFGYNQIQTQARDEGRHATVVVIKNALEHYYSNNGEYPPADKFNPNSEASGITSLTTAGTILGLNESDLATNGYRLYAYCDSGACNGGGDDVWKNYRTKQFIYVSRNNSHSGGSYSYLRTYATTGHNTGFGCQILTYYNKPGFVIAWYKESEKKWIYEKSLHGQVEISNWPDINVDPPAPRTCSSTTT